MIPGAVSPQSIPPSVPEARDPFWGYEDLGLFLGAVLPSLALAALFMRISRMLAPAQIASDTAKSLVFQTFAYIFLIGSLYLVVSWRHRRPFWRSLGWTFPAPRAFALVMSGPILAIGLAMLGVVLGLPSQPSQIEDLITSRASLAIWMIYGVLFAPAFEELVFRGFLFPLISRSVGAWLGIVLTAIPFGILHGAQNHWAWQPVVLISFAGAVFGLVRYRTGSTTSAFFLHAAYNATEFGLYAYTRWAALK